MGRRLGRLEGAPASCSCRVAVVVVVFGFVCVVGLLVVMVATSGVSVGTPVGGRVTDLTTTTTTSSPLRHSSGGGGGAAGADAFRSSKRRIPKGPDPIHNRRAGKTTIAAPRRRD